jgi:N-acetyl-anhydromuramoyl-L-alanine amidase
LSTEAGARPGPVGTDGWHAHARRAPSSNHDARPAGLPIQLLVIHNISLPPGRFGGEAVEQLFTNTLDCTTDPYFRDLEGLRVSAHFFLRRDGTLVQFVSCAGRAWHAGKSRWRGRERCNDFSIGIEVEGTDERPYTARQYRRLAILVRQLIRRYPSISGIAGHDEIAPGRKTDPGAAFDWQRLAAAAGLPASMRA